MVSPRLKRQRLHSCNGPCLTRIGGRRRAPVTSSRRSRSSIGSSRCGCATTGLDRRYSRRMIRASPRLSCSSRRTSKEPLMLSLMTHAERLRSAHLVKATTSQTRIAGIGSKRPKSNNQMRAGSRRMPPRKETSSTKAQPTIDVRTTSSTLKRRFLPWS